MREQAKKPFMMLSAVVFIGSAALVFNSNIEYCHNRSGYEQAPAEKSKQLYGCFYPFKVKHIRTHIAHHLEEVGDSAVDDFIKPFEHCIPNGIGYLCSEEVHSVADGAADPRKDIA